MQSTPKAETTVSDQYTLSEGEKRSTLCRSCENYGRPHNQVGFWAMSVKFGFGYKLQAPTKTTCLNC